MRTSAGKRRLHLLQGGGNSLGHLAGVGLGLLEDRQHDGRTAGHFALLIAVKGGTVASLDLGSFDNAGDLRKRHRLPFALS